MIFRQLFDRESSTYTYLLADPETREAILIDPVRDQVERDQAILEELGLKLVHTFETHVHADHVAGSGVLRKRLGSASVMSKHAGAECADVMADDGALIRVGGIELEVRLTPGHTSGCASYVDHAGKRVFTGDALLIRGCGRTDFQQGDAETLFRSVTEKLFSLPDDYEVYPGHDYKGRTVSTIDEEKRLNPRLGGGKSVAEFVEIMASLNLSQPKKIAEALPLNLACGLAPDETIQASEAPPELAWAPIERTSLGVPEVTAAWVRDHQQEARLVDVREPEELEGPLGAIEGAELVPLGGLAETARDWDREEPLVLFCRSGNRSGKAALALEELGFKRLASMRGGMIAWGRDQDGASASVEQSACG